MVVEESIAHVTAQNARLDEATQHIDALVQERDELLSELNQWRSQAGIVLRQPNDNHTESIQQSVPGEDTQLCPSPTRNPVGVDNLFEPVSENRDTPAFPEITQSSVPHASINENRLLDPFDTVDPPVPVSLIDQAPVVSGFDGPLGDSMMGTCPDIPAHNPLFDSSACLTADMFDTTFVLEALRPSTNMAPIYHNSANVLNLPADLNAQTGNYMA